MTETGGPPRWTRWIQTASIVGFLCLPLGALGTRFGVWPYTVGLGVFGLGVLVIAATGLIGLIGVVALRRGRRDSGALQTGPFLTIVTGFLLFPHISAATSSPAIHQITTDTQNPPPFAAILQLRGVDSNPLGLSADVIEAQREAYPWLVTFFAPITADAAYSTAQLVVEDMAFEIVNEDRFNRTIEATATTFWFGFKDDIAIRIKPASGGALVDYRSVSRVGQGDLGTNADRAAEFFRRYQIEMEHAR
jgi:hypothetical protein